MLDGFDDAAARSMSFLLVSRFALALSADFHVICWESRGAQATNLVWLVAPATFLIRDHVTPTIYPEALVATALT
jgi:hypothetical protein